MSKTSFRDLRILLSLVLLERRFRSTVKQDGNNRFVPSQNVFTSSESFCRQFIVGTNTSTMELKSVKLSLCVSCTVQYACHWLSAQSKGESPLWTACWVRIVSASAPNFPFHQKLATFEDSNSSRSKSFSRCLCSCPATILFFSALKEILTSTDPRLLVLLPFSRLYQLVSPVAGIDYSNI